MHTRTARRTAPRHRATVASLAAVAVIMSSFAATAAFADDGVVLPADLSIAGTLKVGATVSITASDWTPGAGTVSVVWTADGDVVTEPSGLENDLDLALMPDLAGKVIGAEVVETVDGVSSAPVDLTASDAVAAGTFDVVQAPTFTGAVVVGAPVAVQAEWSPAAPDLAYQWSLDGVAIQDATSSSYTPVPADQGHALTASVTASSAGYDDRTETTGAVTVGAGTFTVQTAPTISGSVRVGSKLTATHGTWTPNATFAYSWKVAGTQVSTASTFTPTAAQRGHSLTLTVTASSTGYADVTNTTTPVNIGYGVFSAPAPKVSGSPIIGRTLTSSAGTWTPNGSKAYQWLRNGAVIKGAHYTTYKVSSADYGKRLSLRITGTASGYTTKTVTSAQTGYAVKPFSRTTAPTITGSVHVVSTLTAHIGAWSPTVTSHTWQWKRNGASISGATGSTYKLSTADYGKKITVVYTGRHGGYATTSRTSASTVTVGGPAAVITRSGTYKVGTQIKPGTYAASSGSNCYWERDDSHGEVAEGPMNDRGRVIVTIASTDKTFHTEGCGSWAPFVIFPGTPANSVSDGMYAVGSQLSAGTYSTNSTEYCSFARLSDASGSDDSVIGFGPFNSAGRVIVTISPKDKFFMSSGCGTWTRMATTGTPGTTATDGMYAIGVHLQPGHYQTTGRVVGGLMPDFGCLAAALTGFGGTESEFDMARINVDSATGKADVELSATDKGFVTTGCGTWTRIGD